MLNLRLKEERLRIKKSQPEFAEAAGAKKRTLIDWEKGVSSPTIRQLSSLAEIDVDVIYVLTGIRVDSDTRHRIAAVLKTTAEVDPGGESDLSKKAIAAAIGAAEESKRMKLQRLLAECSDDDLSMVEQLLERLTKK